MEIVMDSKVSENQNFLHSIHLPVFLKAKILIVRILEVIQAVPDHSLFNILKEQKQDEKNSLVISYNERLDLFLLNHCKIPQNFIYEFGADNYSEFVSAPLTDFLQVLYAGDLTRQLFELENDFLGKLNEIQGLENSTKGVVYTPKSIIRHMVKQVMEGFLDDGNDLQLPSANLENVSILDPACGSGSFLIEVFEYLSKMYSKGIESQTTTKNSEAFYQILHNIISHSFGVDIDRIAVIFCQINLWLASIKFLSVNRVEFSFSDISPAIFALLERNIVLGDSLRYIPIDAQTWSNHLLKGDEHLKDRILSENKSIIRSEFLKQHFPYLLDGNFEGFSIILGNPPYISAKDLPSDYKELLRELYTTAVHQFDLYTIFIELSLHLLAKEGLFSFIIPESYLGRTSFAESRRMLLKNISLLKIENVQNAFPEKMVSNVIMYFRNRQDSENHINYIVYHDKQQVIANAGDSVLIPQQYCYNLENSKILYHSPEIREIIEKIHSNTVLLGSYIKIHRGEEIGKKTELILDKPKMGTKKILFGEHIKKFCIEDVQTYIHLKDIKKRDMFYFQPKVIVRQLGDQIHAAFDEKGEYVTLQTVYNIIPTDRSISNELILGLLNSEVIQFYYETVFKEKQMFPRILIENILCIPFKKPESSLNTKLQDCVKRIIQAPITDYNLLVTQLNNLIYELYELSELEIGIIQKYLSA